MEVAPGVHRVINAEQPAVGVANSYLIVGTEGAVWVDTGWNREGEAEPRIAYWRSIGSPPIRGIIATHHHPPSWGNAGALQAAMGGGDIIATATEKDILEERMAGPKVGRLVEDGETLSLGNLTLEFLHASGHTYGSVAVLLREQRALFPGDNIMGTGTSVVNPGEGEIAHFLRTMERFLTLDLAVIYPGQGPIITDPAAKLRELIEHRHQREQEIVAQLEAGPKTLEELFTAIYPAVEERFARLAHSQVRSHLIKLENEGRAVVEGETYRLV